MYRIRKIALLMCVITCLLLIFTEAMQQNSFVIEFSNSSMTEHSSTCSDVKKSSVLTRNVREQNVEEKWKSLVTLFRKMLTIIYNGSLSFTSHFNNNLNLSRNCKRDLIKTLTGIKKYKYWAVKMLDSFAKLPSGVERGALSALGDYDQCLDVNVPGYFKGQYCNLDIITPLPKREPFVKLDTEIPELMNITKPDEYLRLVSKFGRTFYFINPRLSICVPSTCSKEEIEIIVNKAAQTMDFPFPLHIPNCETMNKVVKFDKIEITLMIILGILLLFVISSTAVDVYLKTTSSEDENINNLGLLTKYLLCFSLYTNAKRLLKPNTEKDSIKIFYGIRVLHSLWVILVHTCIFHNFQASGSLLPYYQSTKVIAFQFISNAFINVQAFFFMSAAIHSFRAMKMKEKINIKRHILRRIWRLVPAFMLVIACVILIPHVGSGPVWKETIRDRLAEKCRARWWTNLLFINNFLKNEDMCLEWLWYIAAEFHLYILSLLVIIPMRSNPKVALILNCVIMVGSMAISAAFHVYYKLSPTFIIAFLHPEDIRYFQERGYFRTYVHCSSVCIGLAVGYFLAKKPSKIHIPLKISAPLWLASFCAFFAVILGPYRWSQGNIPSITVSVLYAITHKILWSAGLAWITIACTTGNGGVVAKILSLPVFVPLARLSYMVYLIHSVIHYIYIGSTRSSILLEPRTIVYMYSGTVFLSFVSAFVLSLIFESPFMALEKIIFSREMSKGAKQSVTLDDRKTKRTMEIHNDIIKDMNRHKKVK